MSKLKCQKAKGKGQKAKGKRENPSEKAKDLLVDNLIWR
jgi:uncharacterized protein YjbJ (UPF0337 family)